MTNLQLLREISALPPLLKQDVINYVKKISIAKPRGITNYEFKSLSNLTINEPEVAYNTKNSFLGLLLIGPTFSEKQVQKIIDSRKF